MHHFFFFIFGSFYTIDNTTVPLLGTGSTGYQVVLLVRPGRVPQYQYHTSTSTIPG